MGYAVGYAEGPEPGSVMWCSFCVQEGIGPMYDLMQDTPMNKYVP
jgi:hypothetical protein